MTDSSPIELSVVIPAFNEESRISSTLISTLSYLQAQGWPYEVIVVDDGSTDGTVSVVEGFRSSYPALSLLRLESNRGKGFAVKSGMLRARYSARIFLDADGATPIQEISQLLRHLQDGADVVIASRALPSESTSVRTLWYRKYLGRLFNWCINLLILPGIADTQCGFKLFSGAAANFLFSRQTAEQFSFDVEILYLARKAGMRIDEVAVNWTNVPGSKVNLVVDAAKMFRDVLGFRFVHRGMKNIAWQRE